MSDTRWRLDPAGATAWREWGDEIVVFNERTSSTHRLESLAAAVFSVLARSTGERSLPDIVRELDDDGGGECAATPEEIDRLRDILDSLRQCGLAECRAP